MRHKILSGLLVSVFIFLLGQSAIAQGTDVVPFREQTDQLQGQIYLVVPENNLLIVEKNSVTYSFRITAVTRILVNTQRGNLEALGVRKGQGVTVKFRVTRNGNMAQEISVP